MKGRERQDGREGVESREEIEVGKRTEVTSHRLVSCGDGITLCNLHRPGRTAVQGREGAEGRERAVEECMAQTGSAAWGDC